MDSREEKRIIDLNVGGKLYTTTRSTLEKCGGKLLEHLNEDVKDADGRFFIDRDGTAFEYILFFLRNSQCLLPHNEDMKQRFLCEARFYGIADLIEGCCISSTANQTSDSSIRFEYNTTSQHVIGFIAINCKANVVFGREPQSELRFRRVSRINVCGRINLLREVFSETLNESRDPDHGNSSRYTSRFFLTHNFLEQAFDQLSHAGFKLVGSSTALCSYDGGASSASIYCKPSDLDDGKCFQFSEFIFSRY